MLQMDSRSGCSWFIQVGFMGKWLPEFKYTLTVRG